MGSTLIRWLVWAAGATAAVSLEVALGLGVSHGESVGWVAVWGVRQWG